MNNAKRQEIVDQYRFIMEELTARLGWIAVSLGGETGLLGESIREFCFLQLRMICELIGLACLTAHGEILGANKLKDEYSAGKITKALERLHAGFYPVPAERRKVGHKQWVHEPVTSGFMTRGALISFYGRCGEFLHRGTLADYLSHKRKGPAKFHDIAEAGAKIVKLLEVHEIHLSTGKAESRGVMACILRTDRGITQVVYGDVQPEK